MEQRGQCEGAAGLGLSGDSNLTGDSKGLVLPGPVSSVWGAAWKILSELKSLLLPDLQCDLGKCFHVSVSFSVKWAAGTTQRDQT